MVVVENVHMCFDRLYLVGSPVEWWRLVANGGGPHQPVYAITSTTISVPVGIPPNNNNNESVRVCVVLIHEEGSAIISLFPVVFRSLNP